jgi:small subunit ribosomal protein S17e
MGKVRIEVVKKVARELVSRFPDNFGIEYEANKHQVTEYVEVDGKKLRNRIAGYITRLKRIETQEVSSETE